MQNVDVVVIGGGAAGLSAAVALARSRRSVIVVDSGSPRNAPAEGVHNLLARDGTAPGELLALGRTEAEGYGAVVMPGDVETVEPGFTVRLADGSTIGARRVVVASGVTDALPDIPGLAERWGRDVLHCPYCHGWEVRGRRIGVLAVSDAVAHQAQLFRQLTERVTVFANGRDLPADALAGFAARGIPVVPDRVTGVEVADGRLTGVVAGGMHGVDALVVATRLEPRAGFLASLGIEAVEHPSGIGRYVPSENGVSAVKGVWLAGNVTDPMAQIAVAAGQGLMAGAQVNADLVAEEVAEAVQRAAR